MVGTVATPTVAVITCIGIDCRHRNGDVVARHIVGTFGADTSPRS